MPFLSLLPRECLSRYFLKTFFMYARSISIQTKVHFKKMQFLAVTYDMVFYVVLSTLSKWQSIFPLFKQILETGMTWSQPIIV